MRQVLGIVLLVITLAGCSSEQVVNNHYYYSLTGEGENWSINSYQLEITPNKVKAGNAVLTMKDTSEFLTNSYQIRVFAEIDGEEVLFQDDTFKGNFDKNIAKVSTGITESSGETNISPDKMNTIYLIINWYDMDAETVLEEKIDLYDKHVFLN